MKAEVLLHRKVADQVWVATALLHRERPERSGTMLVAQFSLRGIFVTMARGRNIRSNTESYEIAAREKVSDLGRCGFLGVGAVGAVALDALAELAADGAGSGFGGIGGAHRVTPFRDSVFRFEYHHDCLSGAHEFRQLAEERAFAVHGVKPLRLFLSEAQGFDRDDVKFRSVDAADNVRGKSTAYGIRLNDC